jgi:1-acyl-sn-glycerol-3-phosphate acyltransferase
VTEEKDSGLLEAVLGAGSAALTPLISCSHPYVRGLVNLPADGRFLLVGNHTRYSMAEVVLIPYFVRTAIGTRVRPLADRQFARMTGTQAALVAAYGAVIGTPAAARQLMDEGESVLVFPGGAREIAKYKGEEYTLSWENRDGFARIAIEKEYPIITVALVGGDDVYTSMVRRDSTLGQVSRWVGQRLSGRSDIAMPPVRGVGLTLIPQPQRMYLAFGQPIDTRRSPETSIETWTCSVKRRVQRDLEAALLDLQRIRATDPYRRMNPVVRRRAIPSPC